IDEHCSRNNKIFSLDVKAGKGTCKEDEKQDPDAIIEIGPLTQLVVGYLTANELAEMRELKASKEAVFILEHLFPRCNNFLREFF
ncbi:MAG: sterol carrier protein domain-containing protein, partial [Candidatus Hodarchaeota archaeon]